MSRGARWTLGIFATLFALTGVYSEVTAPSKAPLVMYLFILFCVAIAVACFSASWRVSALRVVGGITFLGTVAYLVYEIRVEPLKLYAGRSEPHWFNAILALVFFGLPGLALAVRAANEGRDVLTQSIQRHLMPVLMKQGFEVARPEELTGIADRDYLLSFPPWGRLMRPRESGVDLVEIQFAKHGRAAFRINAGVAPKEGMTTWTGHRAAENLHVHWLERYFESHARPWLRPGLRALGLEPLGEWFSVWHWTPRTTQQDFKKLALKAASIVPELELALREGQLCPHIRMVAIPFSRRPHPAENWQEIEDET
jgi:hypothetical protein